MNVWFVSLENISEENILVKKDLGSSPASAMY